MVSRLSTSLLLRHLSTDQFLPKSNPFAQSLLNPKPQFTRPQNPSHILLRYLSTRHPTRAIRSDIGARALTFSCIAGFIVIVLNQFQDQLVFYITPTDALQKYNSNPTKSKFRLGGLVLENSVVQVPSSPETQFVITDLITDVLVKYEGSLPDLFREGHSVVVEGFIRPVEEETRRREEGSLGNSSKLRVSD